MDLEFNPSGKLQSYGHHFIVGLSATALNDSDKRILETLRPAGILLLARNFEHQAPYPKWLDTLAKLLSEVKRYSARKELLVSIDHEGGKIHRLPPPITHFPDAIKYAHKAAAVAKAMAIELKSLGVNLSWAPLADIHSNPANPVIGARAFGSTAAAVINAGVPFLQALQAEGLLGCAKHFPGHGDTHQDSHHELPLLELTRQQLFNRELAPFQALIEADVSFIMTAHILFPRIDPLWPATLSKVLLHDILRGQLAFSGVIVGDDLDMKAVSKGFEDSSNVAQAIKAGCDMFIVARHPDGSSLRPLNLAQSFVENLSARRISEDELFASFERIKHALLKLKHYAPAQLDQNTLERHAELARA